MKINRKIQQRLADSVDYCMKRGQLAAAVKLADAEYNSFEDKGIHTGIIKSFNTHVMDSDAGRDFIKTNNYGPFLPELLPIIIAWYPNFPLKDLISVQDMEQDLAYIITSELLTATNKANTFAGEKVETPNGLREIKGKYPTGEIMGEVIESADLEVSGKTTSAALVYFPLLTDSDSLEMTNLVISTADGDVTFVAQAAVNGVISFALADTTKTTTLTATVEVKTGIVTVTDSATTAATITKIEASYVWNIEYADDKNIPSVVEDMKMVPMIAKPRVLGMKWTVFSELVRKSQFKQDIRTQNTKRVLDLLYQYQVRYILDRMYRYAEGGTQTVDGPDQTIVDPNYKAQEILKVLNNVSQIIANNTGRIEGNRLVVGSKFKNYLESLPDIWYKPVKEEDYGFQGPREIGTFAKYKVYYDNELPADEGWMTYRGNEWYDAAYYMGVFMPLAYSDAININIDVKQAFFDMVAHRYDKKTGVVKIKFGTHI